MVPTELLAMQHYEHLLSLLENIKDEDKPSIAILTGSTASKQSRIIRQVFYFGIDVHTTSRYMFSVRNFYLFLCW